jgi:formylglycine-generating enzyme required for sulfatase activity
VPAGRALWPVVYVSFYDALRFANWLHNGQPSGAQDNTTTEDGAYTITAQGVLGNSITRNASATIFLPSQDEWYKAAYYDALSTSYFDYPAGSDTQTMCSRPTGTANRANCWNAVGLPTIVGSYPGSASPSGTFDQGGNVREWTEGVSGSFRVMRGGHLQGDPSDLRAAAITLKNPSLSVGGADGFRVASIPEPGTGLLMMTGLVGLAWLRRSR